MKTVLYIGMDNKPIEVETKCTIRNYQPITEYFTLDGKRVMLKAIKNACSYAEPYNHKQYPFLTKPIIKQNAIVSPSIIDNGYSCHDFEIVII